MSVSPDAFSTCNEISVRVVDPATLLRLTLRSPANQPAPTLSTIALGCAVVPVPTTVNLPSLSGEILKVTSVGEVANENFKNLGHLVLKLWRMV